MDLGKQRRAANPNHGRWGRVLSVQVSAWRHQLWMLLAIWAELHAESASNAASKAKRSVVMANRPGMADGVGFEPTVELPPRQFSRLEP